MVFDIDFGTRVGQKREFTSKCRKNTSKILYHKQKLAEFNANAMEYKQCTVLERQRLLLEF